MSVLDSVISAIRGKRREQAKTITSQYFELVDCLVKGEQVDVDELAIVLDALDKSDSDLAADVARMQRRNELAAQLETALRVEATIPKLEVAHEAAKQKLEQTIEPLRQAVADTHRAITAAAAQSSARIWIERELRDTCSTEILERDQQLDNYFRSLREEADSIQEREHKTIGLYDFHCRRVDEIRDELKDESKKTSVRSLQDTLAEHESEIAKREPIVKAARKRLTEIESEQRRIQSKRAELHKQKLIP